MNRKLQFIGIFSLLFSLLSCGGEAEEVDGEATATNPTSPFAGQGGGTGLNSGYVPVTGTTATPDAGSLQVLGDATSGLEDAAGGGLNPVSDGAVAQPDAVSTADGTVCYPNCGGKTCGDDGCGGSCGTCPLGSACNGTVCINESFAECEGAEGDYQGQFTGFVNFGASGLPDFNLETAGAVILSMDCSSLDAVVEGTFSGTIADTTFTLQLTGTADFGANLIEWDMVEGTVLAMGGQVLYQVEGTGWSLENNENQWSGKWDLKSTSASSVGGNLSPSDIKPLSGTGDWVLGKVL